MWFSVFGGIFGIFFLDSYKSLGKHRNNAVTIYILEAGTKEI